MLTEQHILSLQAMVVSKDSSAIYTLLKNLSVADQKRAKLVLAECIGKCSNCSVAEAMSLYISLLTLDLNFFFQAFIKWSEANRTKDDMWNLSASFIELGELLSRNKVYYRQKFLSTLFLAASEYRPLLRVLDEMQVNEPRAQVAYLLESNSVYALYQMFLLLCQSDMGNDYIQKCCYRLLKPNAQTVLSNEIREDIVNFIVHYFNNIQLAYPFRRRLDIATFSYAETSYHTFLRIVVPPNRIEAFCKR